MAVAFGAMFGEIWKVGFVAQLPQELNDTGVSSAKDGRRPAYGLGRIVIAGYVFFAIYALSVTVQDVFFGGFLGPRLVSLSAAVGYVVAAVGMAHNGRRMRILSWGAVGFELVGVLMVGALGIGVEQLTPVRTLWDQFGVDYFFAPLFLPLIGVVWLWWSNPRRIVQIAESQG